MPTILELKEIDGEVWARVGKPGDFPSGAALWTPDEQEAARQAVILEAVAVVQEARETGETDHRSIIYGIECL